MNLCVVVCLHNKMCFSIKGIGSTGTTVYTDNMTYTEQLLKHPFSLVVSGPSKAGKTVFVTKLVQHVDAMSTCPPEEIIWYFSEYQTGYRSLAVIPRLRLVQGLPDLNELRQSSGSPKLIVLDDLMSDVKDKGKEMLGLFTKGVHHWNISCCFIVQNLFFGGLRTARVNAHYISLFKSPSDKLQVSTLARQMYPKKSHVLTEAFEDATAEAYNYLFVDLSQDCPEELRLRTNIFPGETTIVYTP